MRKSNYSLGEIIYNAMCLLKTKLFFPKARFVRHPITIRGKKYIDFNEGFSTGKDCQLEVNGNHNCICMAFGKNVIIGHNVRIQCAEKITIGNNVLMGSRVTIIDNSHGNYSGENQDSPLNPPNTRKLKTAPIKIGDNVWVGDGVVIQGGVTVGSGCILAANSVITHDVPVNSIAGGVPAKVIKKFNKESQSWERF